MCLGECFIVNPGIVELADEEVIIVRGIELRTHPERGAPAMDCASSHEILAGSLTVDVNPQLALVKGGCDMGPGVLGEFEGGVSDRSGGKRTVR